MNEGPAGTYGQQLLVALRRREVPSPRIAEALAEVDAPPGGDRGGPGVRLRPARRVRA